MNFEWDRNKNAENIRRHGIPFEVAAQIFESPTLESHDDRDEYGEDRWVALGIVNGRLVTVVFTERGEVVRLISARKATTDERKTFEAWLTGR